MAEQVLAPATAVGEAFGAEYILIRVVSPLTMLPTVSFQGLAPWNDAVERERAAARRRMEEVAAGMRESGYRVTVVVSDEDEPVKAILRLVATSPDSLLAMATQGRGGLRRAFMGSTADKLVRATAHPMLLVRPSRHQPGTEARTQRDALAASR